MTEKNGHDGKKYNNFVILRRKAVMSFREGKQFCHSELAEESLTGKHKRTEKRKAVMSFRDGIRLVIPSWKTVCHSELVEESFLYYNILNKKS